MSVHNIYRVMSDATVTGLQLQIVVLWVALALSHLERKP